MLEDVNRTSVIGREFTIQELFPEITGNISSVVEYHVAVTPSVERGILRFSLFSRPNGGEVLNPLGKGNEVDGGFEREKDPSRIKNLLYRDSSLVKNSCTRE